MIKFVLHDTCQIATYPFIMLLEVLVQITNMDLFWTAYRLTDTRYGQTSSSMDASPAFSS